MAQIDSDHGDLAPFSTPGRFSIMAFPPAVVLLAARRSLRFVINTFLPVAIGKARAADEAIIMHGDPADSRYFIAADSPRVSSRCGQRRSVSKQASSESFNGEERCNASSDASGIK